MKRHIKKRISFTKMLALAIWLPSLILISFSGYFLYINYNKYEKAQTSLKYLQLAKRMEQMLLYLGQERAASSIYAVSKGEYPNSKQILAQKRALFSNAVNQFKDYAIKHPEFNQITMPIITLLNKLPQVRHDIDQFKRNYIKNEFFTYYTMLENTIMRGETKIFKYFPTNIKHLYVLKFQFTKMMAYSGITRGFGSYYITADTPMSQKEYMNVLLKYYHDTNILLTNLLKDPKIRALYSSTKFKKIEKQIKAMMFYIQQANQEYYLTNNFNGYPIDALDYFHLWTKRISYFKKTVDSINKEINSKLNQYITQTINTRNINYIIFVIAILILIIGYLLNKEIVKHIRSLSNLINTLTPITNKKITANINTPEGMDNALQIVDEAIRVTQESIKKTEEATKAKSLFLASMSHEIRTPLNGILGFLELLKTTPINSEQQEYISTIEQSSKNLLQIVNNILDVSKIESNKISLELIDFKALYEFENTVEIFSTPAAQKNIEYVTDISPNIPNVLKGDILKIKEILTNLINNAIKFTHKNGTISVKIKNNGIKDNKVNLYFEVKDTGIGMSEEQKAKIFEAFSQADESVTRKYGGTGLGLTIVKNYIEMMGGKIQVESEINKGSKFYFDLNFEIVDKTPRYQPDSLKNQTFAILHTEKSSLRKDVSLEYLTFFGINKIGFNNAEEIEKLIKTENINAIIVFYQESDKNTIKNIIDKKLNIPTIFISSYAYKEEIDKLKPDLSIYDPNTPSKTYNISESLKETKTNKKIEVIETPIYKLKALIAEDNPINMQLLTTTLKNMGMQVDTAQNGLEAFNKYSMNPEKYDVIFMDAQMPVMDGIEATHEIIEFEEEEGIPHTPIVAVTANVLKGDRERFLGAGMDDYISKPINMQELKRVLEKISKHKYQKTYHIHTETKDIKKPKTKSVEKPETENIIKVPQTEESKKEPKLIIASESPFLINYFKNILNQNFETAENIKELSQKLDKNYLNIILIEEDFAGSNIEKFIDSIKTEYPNSKFIVISDKKIESADEILDDLNEDKIKNIIKKASE